jgi:MoaA/NifB/PqqE/SkfB family radical SAM enzyme
MNMENIGKVTSYTSANALPIKIFTDKELMKLLLEEGKIFPAHLQLVPTNRCNLKCSYCSFDERTLKQELSPKELDKIIETAYKLGTKGVTLTGGGEPMLHNYMNELLENINAHGMKAGLVSNGKDLSRFRPENINLLTWYRISFDTERKWDKKFQDGLDKIVAENKSCDLAFSYVVSKKMDGQDLRTLVKYANDNNFSHVRIVENIFDPGVMNMDQVKDFLKDMDTSKVVYQGKKEWTHGVKDCYISLMKPFIAADGYIYPCCGITYALGDEKREPLGMRMGHFTEWEKIVEKQQNFDGSACIKCFYPEYNAVLKALKSDIHHKEFI